MKLSIQQIYEAARAAGFTPDQATTWTAIAMAESGGETGALNDQGEHSMGLWQINVGAGVRTNHWGNLNDPFVNARAAYEISRQGTDMRPWTTTHASNAGTAADYRTYLDDVSAITGYTGDPRGVEGYGSPLPDPLPPSGPPDSVDYDAIDAGIDPADPSANVDTDHDGLTDAFEVLSGSSPSVADTDQDGLSDANEVTVSHTDPMLADSDSDTLTDAAESALGTSPTEWDSDSDGISDATEEKYGTDPLRAEHGTVPQPLDAPDPSDPMGTTTTTTTTTAAGTGMTGGMAGGTTGTGDTTGTSNLADAFVQAAVEQQGDSYVFGAEASLDDPNPDSFDCSELTQWAADQVGVTIPDGAMYQYLDLKSQGQLMPVEEALHTKGALLFYFSSEPTANGGRPSEAHVAISLGDGRTIEARGTSYGVNEFPGEGRFNYAGVIPEMSGPAPDGLSFDHMDTGMLAGGQLDSDSDGLSDTFERLAGLDPMSADSDHDGLDDALETLGGAGGTVPAGLSQSLDDLAPAGDEDRDGLTNKFELAHGLDPFDVDTDADGLSDSAETALGTDPTLVDSDHDGLTDQWEMEFGGGALGGDTSNPWADLDTAPVGGGDLGDQDDLLG